MELLGVVPELVARRPGQRLGRDARPVVAAPELVGAREMIERTAAVAFGEPEEAERAMGVVVARIDRADPPEALQSVARLAERLQRRGAVVMRDGILRFGSDRGVEMGEGFAMPALGRGDYAEIVDDGRMTRSEAKRVTVGGLGLIESPSFVMGDRVGYGLLEWARHNGRRYVAQTPTDAATSVSLSMSESFTAPISSVTFLMPRSSHQASRSSMIWTSAVGLRKPA